MKCFRRSIRSFASSSLWLLLWAAPLYGDLSTALEAEPSTPLAAAPSTSREAEPTAWLGADRVETGVSPTDSIIRAIQIAVRARVGREISVSVLNVSGVRLTSQATSLSAVPDPSARIGAPVRFVLADVASGRRTRLGEVTATIHVSAPAVRARRAIARGTRLDSEDVALLDTDLSGHAFRPLPSLEDTLGARATHDIAEDALLTQRDIVPEPVIRAGEIVRAHVHVGDVELVGSVIAAESGMKNELIRVVNQESRYAFRARILGSGEVEVVNVR